VSGQNLCGVGAQRTTLTFIDNQKSPNFGGFNLKKKGKFLIGVWGNAPRCFRDGIIVYDILFLLR